MGTEVDFVKLSDCDLTPEKIVVKHSGLVRLQYIEDLDGNLTIAEIGDLPFNDIKRLFWRQVPNRDANVGHHAHKNTEQVITCHHGFFTLHLDDGRKQQDILMDVDNIGVYLGKELWHSMNNFQINSMYLVIANTRYDESDYIRDYDKFLKYVGSDGKELVD